MAAATGAPPRLTAHERLTRSAAAFVGVGGLVYGMLTAPSIVAQMSLNPWLWTPVAVTAVFGSSAIVPLAAARGTTRAIRHSIVAFAALFLIAEVSWFLTLDYTAKIPAEQGVWLSLFPRLAALALSIIWPSIVVFAYLTVVSVLGQLQNFVVQADFGDRSLVLDIAYAITFSALFCGACSGVVRSGRTLDDTAQSARSSAAQSAAAEARGAERRRFDALIHDGVMATFLSASRTANDPALALQASETLHQLDRLRSGASSTDDFDVGGFIAHIRMSAAVIDDAALVTVEQEPESAELSIPPDTTRAFGAGVIEAIRNVERHAGDASYQVRVRVAEASVRVDVVDDGIGFDPDDVRRDRLGLQVSIRGRFDELPGGWSRVESARPGGTRIAMGWRRPADAAR